MMKRLLMSGILAATLVAGSGTVARAAQYPGPGQVLFGTGLSHHTLAINHRLWSIRQGGTFWASAAFTQPAGPTIRLVVEKQLGVGMASFVAAQTMPIPDPRDTAYAARFHPSFGPGSYVFEFLHGSTILAMGTIRITR